MGGWALNLALMRSSLVLFKWKRDDSTHPTGIVLTAYILSLIHI